MKSGISGVEGINGTTASEGGVKPVLLGWGFDLISAIPIVGAL